MDYTRLSLSEVTSALHDVARDAQANFGDLEFRQLNWKPEPSRWSVAQCFQHLLTANQLMLESATHALRQPPTTVWQRLPLLPGLFGRILIRSQSPNVSRQFTAPVLAQPTDSDIPADVIARFVDQQRDAAEWIASLHIVELANTIMISPFIRVVTYSVLDGCRLVAAHNRRHFEQARGVIRSQGFPSGA